MASGVCWGLRERGGTARNAPVRFAERMFWLGWCMMAGRITDLLVYERELWEQGRARVAGVDEAGRGPLAGPVVAAAVVMPARFAETAKNGLLAGLTDSKKLSASRREHFFAILTASEEIESAVALADTEEIDRLNILRATHLAMGRAVSMLEAIPDHVLVDGLPVTGFGCPSTALVKGDGRSLSIAAASVLAKVTRDRMMVALDERYPGYGFSKHKGYGAKAHIRSLYELGPCPEHRRSFRPVREAAALRERADASRELL
jgi:ribonuclease HII